MPKSRQNLSQRHCVVLGLYMLAKSDKTRNWEVNPQCHLSSGLIWNTLWSFDFWGFHLVLSTKFYMKVSCSVLFQKVARINYGSNRHQFLQKPFPSTGHSQCVTHYHRVIMTTFSEKPLPVWSLDIFGGHDWKAKISGSMFICGITPLEDTEKRNESGLFSQQKTLIQVTQPSNLSYSHAYEKLTLLMSIIKTSI